jgi:enoyl-CoA hydratase
MSFIELSFDGAVAFLTLSRPAKLNAITPEMLAHIEAAIVRIEDESVARVVVLSGQGKAFSVGADINVWSSLSAEDFRRRWVIGGHRAFNRLAQCRLPVIAALNGMAFGGGLELALAADLRIAEENTVLALPEVSLGTVPGWGGTQKLPELIGIARAKQMILTAERIDAKTAESWNLVNTIAPLGTLHETAVELARKISQLSPISVQIAKSLIDSKSGAGIEATLETLAGMATLATDDLKEGLAALREKRAPTFEGR